MMGNFKDNRRLMTGKTLGEKKGSGGSGGGAVGCAAGCNGAEGGWVKVW